MQTFGAASEKVADKGVGSPSHPGHDVATLSPHHTPRVRPKAHHKGHPSARCHESFRQRITHLPPLALGRHGNI